jgi:hypothetical protein
MELKQWLLVIFLIAPVGLALWLYDKATEARRRRRRCC